MKRILTPLRVVYAEKNRDIVTTRMTPADISKGRDWMAKFKARMNVMAGGSSNLQQEQ